MDCASFVSSGLPQSKKIRNGCPPSACALAGAAMTIRSGAIKTGRRIVQLRDWLRRSLGSEPEPRKQTRSGGDQSMQAQSSQDCGNCGAGLNVDNGAAGWIGNCGQTRANHLVASDSQLR